MKTVLLIDDEIDLCNILKNELQKEGYDVECAFNLAEASQKLHVHRDIILMDYNLPDGTGLSYIKLHRQEFEDSFIVLISADPNRHLEEIAGEGIQALITKPFSMKQIKEILKLIDSN